MFVTTNRLVAGLFAAMLAGAAFFAQERVLFADSSFILLRLLNEGSLQIQEHRYGSFITQGVPLAASYLHLPIHVIVVLYSLSFNVFYLAAVLLLLHRFKEKNLAYLMSFYFILFASDTFFWMNNEVHQGMTWMFLFFAVALSLGRKKPTLWITFPVVVLLAFFALFTHPLVLFPTGFLWLFFIGKKDWPYRRMTTIFFSLPLVLLIFLKLSLSSSGVGHYDAEKLQYVKAFSLQKMAASFRSPLANELAKQVLFNYWIVPLLYVAGLVAAWRQREYRLVSLSIFFSAVYLLALLLTFTDFLPFYTESELMPATVFLTTPFVYCLLPKWQTKRQVLVIAALFLIRLGYIGFAAPKWVERKEWVLQTLATMRREQVTKGLVEEDEAIKKRLLLTWGTPAESLLASALSGEKPQRTFVVDKAANLHKRMPVARDEMIGCFEVLPYSVFNSRYFQLDTAAGYHLLGRERP